MGKEIKNIDLSQWTKWGEGGQGITYLNDNEPGVVLKIVKRKGEAGRQIAEREYEISGSPAIFRVRLSKDFA